MSSERWQVLSPYLDQALDLDGEARATWLAALQEEDPSLADDVRALLDEHRLLEAERFLEQGVPQGPAGLAGQVVGAYRLVEPLGEGGMGSVWLARRDDGRFEGLAAVKFLSLAFLGPAGEERFAREGSILARLTHPHIARLIDAGVLPMGLPYLVLEHVAGERIDLYCDNARLGIEARIGLFLDVLSAVAHAHANLIVHRDLKPSNVLISDGGQVKLLDFGIAKLLQGEARSGEATALTREGGSALTPEYAAPEQLTAGPITTATDVYSLGVLLYVLLAGQHPTAGGFESPAEIVKAVLEGEPRRLSEALTKAPQALAERAARCGTTPEKLRRRLRGELEIIVAKALKKPPLERYPSVTALADDLRRYLHDQPISARRDTWSYRAAKFVRRNRALVALVVLAVVAVLAGLVGVVTQARRATRQAELAEVQRARADEEARQANEQRDFALRQLSRAEAVNDLNQFLLTDAAPSGKPFTVGDLLARAEGVVDRQYGEDAENRVAMLIAIGRQYDVQDEEEKARRVLHKAYEQARTISDRGTKARAACALAGVSTGGGEMERAEGLLAEADREMGNEPQFSLARVFCLQTGSSVARDRGAPEVAIDRIQNAQRLLEGSPLSLALLRLRIAMDVAESYRVAGRLREADRAFVDASRRVTALGYDDTETASTLFNNWGLTLYLLGQPLRAEGLLRRAIDIESTQATAGGVSPMLLTNCARPLIEVARYGEAADYAERGCATAKRAGHAIVVGQALLLRVEVYRLQRRFPRAAATLAEAESQIRQTMPEGHVIFGALASERALLAENRGDSAAAQKAADEAVSIIEKSGQTSSRLARFLIRRSGLSLRTGDAARALTDAQRAVRLEQELVEPGAFSNRLGSAFLAVAQALRAQGQRDEARNAGESARAHLEPTLGAEHPETRSARLLASPPEVRAAPAP